MKSNSEYFFKNKIKKQISILITFEFSMDISLTAASYVIFNLAHSGK